MSVTEGILGRKVGMTQIFGPEGNCITVTVVKAGPCQIMKKKTVKTDNYNALQVGFEPIREKLVNKPVLGYYHKKGVEACRHLREFRVTEDILGKYEEKDQIKADLFNPGDYVDVTGTSKGRGFTGVMKRHNFGGAKATHGVHEYFRHPGSIGASAYPSRVFKGKKMPGQHGNARVTVQNLQIVHVIPEQDLILIKGAIPGHKAGLVEIKMATKLSAKKPA